MEQLGATVAALPSVPPSRQTASGSLRKHPRKKPSRQDASMPCEMRAPKKRNSRRQQCARRIPPSRLEPKEDGYGLYPWTILLGGSRAKLLSREAGGHEHGSNQEYGVLLGGSRAKPLFQLGRNQRDALWFTLRRHQTKTNLTRRPFTPIPYHGDHSPNLGGTSARHFCQFGCGVILEGPSAGLLPVGTLANQGDAPTDAACSQALASTSAPSIKGEYPLMYACLAASLSVKTITSRPSIEDCQV